MRKINVYKLLFLSLFAASLLNISAIVAVDPQEQLLEKQRNEAQVEQKQVEQRRLDNQYWNRQDQIKAQDNYLDRKAQDSARVEQQIQDRYRR